MLKSTRDRSAMPGPAYMSEEQKADYLRGLRTSNSRPSGARPPPPPPSSSLYGCSGVPRAESRSNVPVQPTRPALLASSHSMPGMHSPQSSDPPSLVSRSSIIDFAGRPLVREPSQGTLDVQEPNSTAEAQVRRKISIPYMERGTRWMEKQEVKSIRMALQDMDLETEQNLHAAARDEAAELVYRHQNPDVASGAPYPNPDVRRDYNSHLRKGSYQRSISQEITPDVASRKSSGGSHEESKDVSSIASKKRRSIEVLRKVSPPLADVIVHKRRSVSKGKSYDGLAEAVANDIQTAHRRSSSGSSASRRILSGEKKRVFMHPNDRIWEDPQEDVPSPKPLEPEPEKVHVASPATTTAPPAQMHTRKNPFARVRMQQATDKLERSSSEPIIPTMSMPPQQHQLHHRVEIQRNPPSQSRRPWYVSNEPLPPTPPPATDQAADEVSPKVTPTKDGREIRSDDIRAATSKKRTDYSPKLPRPTVVSDKPGRPIVSFQHDWKPKEVVLERVNEPSKPRQPDDLPSPSTSASPAHRPTPAMPRIDGYNAIPSISVTDAPVIPTIVLPEEPDFAELSQTRSAPVTPFDPPTINIPPPTIHVHDDDMPTNVRNPRAPPSPPRPLPTHAATSPLPMSRPHYTPSVRQSNTLCAHCALPIAGRILSASGERFHPACFVCHQCHTNLELVAFYPEPEAAYTERVARIQARRHGDPAPGDEHLSSHERAHQDLVDGDPVLRFYCHLDFHELFSPRCKSCKTPIEGEVIVACGAEWHAGHFFCAQCGDPFDSTTPFVEKDGYAWCVGCHTNRTSSRCRKCRKPVVETVLKALGFDWHAECFVCTECNREFSEGRYFLRGASQDPVCVKCEERRLKA